MFRKYQIETILNGLSPLELVILYEMITTKGIRHEDIGTRHNCSPATVRYHLQKMYRLLDPLNKYRMDHNRNFLIAVFDTYHPQLFSRPERIRDYKPRQERRISQGLLKFEDRRGRINDPRDLGDPIG